jgi:hypothetical protein
VIIQERENTSLERAKAALNEKMVGLEAAVEGIDLEQAKGYPQAQERLEWEIERLRQQLMDRPSEMSIAQTMAELINTATTSAVAHVLPFVQTTTGVVAQSPALLEADLVDTNEAVRYCGKCGKNSPVGNAFCCKCGAAL